MLNPDTDITPADLKQSSLKEIVAFLVENPPVLKRLSLPGIFFIKWLPKDSVNVRKAFNYQEALSHVAKMTFGPEMLSELGRDDSEKLLDIVIEEASEKNSKMCLSLKTSQDFYHQRNTVTALSILTHKPVLLTKERVASLFQSCAHFDTNAPVWRGSATLDLANIVLDKYLLPLYRDVLTSSQIKSLGDAKRKGTSAIATLHA